MKFLARIAAALAVTLAGAIANAQVAQPDILLIFGESSGTAITQYGTADAGYVINEGGAVENTDYSWHPNADETLSYLETEHGVGGPTIWLTTSATTPGTNVETVNAALRFRVEAFDTGLGTSWLLRQDSPLRIELVVPEGEVGDFDLLIRFRDNIGAEQQYRIEGLSFDVDYTLSTSLDYSNPAQTRVRYKLDSDAVVEPATFDWSLGSPLFADGWPMLLADDSFWFNMDRGSIQGRIYWLAFQRGGTAWSSTDLTNINSDPFSFISGWPGGGGGSGESALPVILQQLSDAANDDEFEPLQVANAR